MFSDVSAVDDFWKHCGEKRTCISRDISPLVKLFATIFNNYWLTISLYLPRCFKSRLLQICCMWEMFGISNIIFLISSLMSTCGISLSNIRDYACRKSLNAYRECLLNAQHLLILGFIDAALSHRLTFHWCYTSRYINIQ